MKRFIKACLCLLLILAMLPASALARGSADGSPRLRQVMTGMGTLQGVNKTNYLIAQEPGGKLWGLFTTDGVQVMDYEYPSLYYLDYDCFRSSAYTYLKAPKNPTLDYINSNALVTCDGTLLTDFIYGSIKVYNHYWAACWILEDADADDYDYKYDSKHFYRIVRCDIIYMGGQAVPGGDKKELAYWYASLSRDQFKSAQAHERYLSIRDRQDRVTMYDSSFKPVQMGEIKLDTSPFTVVNYAVRKPDGAILIDGLTQIREIDTRKGMLLIGSWKDYSGQTISSIFNLDGEMLMEPTDMRIRNVAGDYAVLDKDGKQGLYSLAESRLIVPCQYDKIISNDTGVDPYLTRGFACGEKDGARYFYNVATGQETMTFVYNREQMRVIGGLVYYTNENKRTVIMNPEGNKTELLKEQRLTSNRGDGYLIPYKQAPHYGLMDWNGENILNTYSRQISVTDDGKIILNSTTDGYQLYELAEP